MTYPKGTAPNGPYKGGPCPMCGQPTDSDVLTHPATRTYRPCGCEVKAP